MKRITSLALAFVMTLTISVQGFAANTNTKNLTTNVTTHSTLSAHTTWIRLGSSHCDTSLKFYIGGVLFSELSLIIPSGYPVATFGSTMISIAISTGGLTNTGRVYVTQYRSSGEINSLTKIKNVFTYYGINSSGSLVYLGTDTSYTTLGDIYNTYVADR